MARPRVALNGAGVRALLTDPGVQADLQRRADAVLREAQATAPRKTGHYADGLFTMAETHTGRSSRAAVHVGARADYSLAVEATHGVLTRALDAAKD